MGSQRVGHNGVTILLLFTLHGKGDFKGRTEITNQLLLKQGDFPRLGGPLISDLWVLEPRNQPSPQDL